MQSTRRFFTSRQAGGEGGGLEAEVVGMSLAPLASTSEDRRAWAVAGARPAVTSYHGRRTAKQRRWMMDEMDGIDI
jgi:hypothetical protein